MKKYIIPRMQVLAVDALLPLMLSDYDEVGNPDEQLGKGRKAAFDDDDDSGW